MWVVPGAPLPHGSGWRIWYSNPGSGDFVPTTPTVTRATQGEPVEARWKILPALPELDRRMGVLTLEVKNPNPGALYDITIPEADPLGPKASGTFRWRSLADSIEDGVTFLFASCFWQPNDKEGAYASAVAQLIKADAPAFKLLIGDQIYQDYPVNWILPKSSFDLYADRYESYWGDSAYREVLTSSPNLFLCDDHEFWNDYPERQVHLPRTWIAAGREELADAAAKLYDRYQRSVNPDEASFYSFDIGSGARNGAASPPVSFFVSDSRSERDPVGSGTHHFFQEHQWQALEAWAHDLHGPGLLVIGQPLFQKDGDWKDHSLSNFPDDYGRLCQILERTLTGDGQDAHDILMLTGDIHNGRYAVGTLCGPSPVQLHELVASPASHVGPYLFPAHVQQPPTRFGAEYQGQRSTWDVALERPDILPTIDNNLGSVRMSPGTNGRVRFELTLWRIRPYDDRSFWHRIIGSRQPHAPVTPIFQKEIQLR